MVHGASPHAQQEKQTLIITTRTAATTREARGITLLQEEALYLVFRLKKGFLQVLLNLIQLERNKDRPQEEVLQLLLILQRKKLFLGQVHH